MTDQTNTQPEAADDEVTVKVHLNVLGTDEAVVQTVAIGVGSPTILLATDAVLGEDGEPVLEVSATIPGDLGHDLEGVDILATIAEAFHRAVQGSRPALVERLIQPTAPDHGAVTLDGLDDRP